MSVNVGTDVVIDDSLVIQGVVGASGRTDNFYSNVTELTNGTINFSTLTPMVYMTMDQNVTFTITSYSPGQSIMLLLDTSSDSHTPTFTSSQFNWPDAAEPTWGDYRYWQISLQTVGGESFVRASAIGYEATSSPPTESVSLLGTQSSPITITGLSNENTGGTTFGWVFYANGKVHITNTNDTGDNQQHSSWCSNSPPQNSYWIRFTTNSGEEIDETISADLNTWHAMTSGRSAKWSMGYQVFYSGSIKVEIATDSAGSTIAATGYYGIQIESGE